MDRQDTVPRELLLSLLGEFEQSQEKEVEILVGEAPEWFPKDLILPGDTRVLGSRVHDEEDGKHVKVVGTTAQSPEGVAAEYRRVLFRQGWKKEDLEGGGFRRYRQGISVDLCKGDTSLSASPRASESTGTQLHLSYRVGLRENHPCNRERRVPENPSLAPVLERPEGVTSIEMGGSTHSGYGERLEQAYANAEADLSASELATRYGKQLREQGWTLERKRNTDGLAAWYWHLKDEESGRRWTGLFTVVTVPDSSGQKYRLRFEMWEPDASE